jgi:hypothetical protein
VDLADAASIGDILDRLIAKKNSTPDGELILGLNFNYDVVREKRLPRLPELDRISSSHPVMVQVYDVHSAMVNSRMLEMLDLPGDLEGYIKDENGAPTGLIEDPAIATALQKLLPDNEDEILATVHAAVQEALSVGITTLHVKEPRNNLAAILQHEKSLPVRVNPMVIIKSPLHRDLDDILESETYRGRATIAFFADGAPDSKTAAFFEPYLQDPTHYGMLYYPDDELESLVEKTHRAGYQISVHTCGTRATEQVLGIYERVIGKFPRSDHRHRIEHFEMPLGDHIKRAVGLNLALAMQPMFLYLSGEGTFDNIRSILGDDRALRWKPFRTILNAGGLIAGGSDAPVTRMSPLKGMEACIRHPNQQESISRYEALKLFTLNGARIGFEEHIKGSIEPGKVADFAVLSDNPFTVEADRLGQINVEMTIVGGEIVYKA